MRWKNLKANHAVVGTSPRGGSTPHTADVRDERRMKKIAVILLLMSMASSQAEAATNSPSDATLAKLTNGMTECQIRTILGVAGRNRENAPLPQAITEYDFEGMSVWTEMARTGEDKSLRATVIRVNKDGLSVSERNRLRSTKWSAWVEAHQVKTNRIPNNGSQPTLDPGRAADGK